MKLILDETIESLPIFKELKILFDNLVESKIGDVKVGDAIDCNKIFEVNHVPNPVRYFLEYYFEQIGRKVDSGSLAYMENALFTAKGGPDIITKMKDILGFEIEYVYDYPKLELTVIEGVKLTNIGIFISNLRNALNYLLYYSTLDVYFKNLWLILRENVQQYTAVAIGHYRNYSGSPTGSITGL